MRKTIAVLLMLFAIVACHDSERYLPTSPDFQGALTAEPASGSLPADGFSTLAITATISPAAEAGNRMIEFITTDGTFVDSGTKTAEKTIDSSGKAVVHLRSSQTPGSVQVTVRVKGKDTLVRTIPVTFTAVDAANTLQLSAERGTAPADDFTPTQIVAQLGAGVPQAGRTVTFVTTAGRFLQAGATPTTATVIADQSGRARVDLVGPQTPTLARVTATAFNVSQEVLVQFVPALPDLIIVKPAKLTLQAGSGNDSTTTVTIEMYRATGKVSIGIIPSIRVVDPATGNDLQFLIRSVSPSNAAGVSQAEITAGATPFRGIARIEVRVEGSSAVGTSNIQIVSPPAS